MKISYLHSNYDCVCITDKLIKLTYCGCRDCLRIYVFLYKLFSLRDFLKFSYCPKIWIWYKHNFEQRWITFLFFLSYNSRKFSQTNKIRSKNKMIIATHVITGTGLRPVKFASSRLFFQYTHTYSLSQRMEGMIVCFLKI